MTTCSLEELNGQSPAMWGRSIALGCAATCGLPCSVRAVRSLDPRSEPPLCSLLNRYALLRKSKERQGLDGLNNLNYFANITYDALYKNITVNLTPELAQVTEY